MQKARGASRLSFEIIVLALLNFAKLVIGNDHIIECSPQHANRAFNSAKHKAHHWRGDLLNLIIIIHLLGWRMLNTISNDHVSFIQ
jgi:hypothetical protein